MAALLLFALGRLPGTGDDQPFETGDRQERVAHVDRVIESGRLVRQLAHDAINQTTMFGRAHRPIEPVPLKANDRHIDLRCVEKDGILCPLCGGRTPVLPVSARNGRDAGL
jgi:hypothetical protein